MENNLRLKVMQQDELLLLKKRIEELLEKKGVMVDHEEMLSALKEKGAVVEGKNVKFPKEIINKALKSVPSEFTLAAPDPQYDLKFPHPEGKFYVRTNTGGMNYYTVDGESHYILLDEVEEWIRLVNAMENVDYCTLPSTSGNEVPIEAIDVYTLHKVLQNSKKHIWIQPYEAENVTHLINMAAAAAGGIEELRKRPIVSFIACSVPLLQYKKMDAEILYRCALNNIPVQPCSLPTAGANTPITGQGTAFVAAAEVLAMIIMIQLIGPGTPVIATPLLFSMDMMTTYTLQSSSEITLGRLIAMQLFEDGYNIRAHSYGTGTDSLTIDEQNMIERTSLIHMMAMSDASVLGGAGQLETAKTISPIQLIIDNEIFGIAQVLRKGLKVDDETIDWQEVLEKEGQEGFIASEHTFDHFQEVHRPELFNKDGMITWVEEGKKSLLDKAVEKYHELKNSPDVYELSVESKKAIDDVLEHAKQALVK